MSSFRGLQCSACENVCFYFLEPIGCRVFLSEWPEVCEVNIVLNPGEGGKTRDRPLYLSLAGGAQRRTISIRCHHEKV